jgi:uncharacterized coiled-coil DUF342 family protein
MPIIMEHSIMKITPKKDEKPQTNVTLSQQMTAISDVIENLTGNDELTDRLKAIQFNLQQLRKAQKKSSVSISMNQLLT